VEKAGVYFRKEWERWTSINCG